MSCGEAALRSVYLLAVSSIPLLNTPGDAVGACAVAQVELEILRAHDRIEAICVDLKEAERLIEPLRRAHNRQSVESNELITTRPCRSRQPPPRVPGPARAPWPADERRRLSSATSGGLKGRTATQPTGSSTSTCQEQRASGRQVGPGQCGDFRLEVLEAQIDRARPRTPETARGCRRSQRRTQLRRCESLNLLRAASNVLGMSSAERSLPQSTLGRLLDALVGRPRHRVPPTSCHRAVQRGRAPSDGAGVVAAAADLRAAPARTR